MYLIILLVSSQEHIIKHMIAWRRRENIIYCNVDSNKNWNKRSLTDMLEDVVYCKWSHYTVKMTNYHCLVCLVFFRLNMLYTNQSISKFNTSLHIICWQTWQYSDVIIKRNLALEINQWNIRIKWQMNPFKSVIYPLQSFHTSLRDDQLIIIAAKRI